VKNWPAANPRGSLLFSPTSCSWLNMVEIFFGIITQQAIRRGSFTSVEEPEATIRAFITSYNRSADLFNWVKTADHLLGKIQT